MKLVLPFFYIIISIVAFLILLFLVLVIRINVKEIRISNIENGTKKKQIEKTYNVFVELLIFGKIKIAKIKLNKKTLEKLKLEDKLENAKKDAGNIKKDIEIAKKVHIFEIIKKLNIKIEQFKLYGEIGTENAMITAFSVASISSILGILLRKSNYEKTEFKIIPLYQYGNAINFRLNCIINVKLVHIINIIYNLSKKGMIKNERTSNRRPYDYSYE